MFKFNKKGNVACVGLFGVHYTKEVVLKFKI